MLLVNIIDSGVSNTVSVVGAHTVLIENAAGEFSLDYGIMKFGGSGINGYDINEAGTIWYDTSFNPAKT
ncbi:MAG: hypothetical protein ACREBH_02640 [Candidatus Micrarchaeaceae archaeon]